MDRVRVGVLAAVFFLPLGGLEARLIYMQILARDSIVGRSLTSQQSLSVDPAPRGTIVDRTGTKLAWDERTFDLWVILEEFEKDAAPRRAAEALFGASLQEDFDDIYAKIDRTMERRPERERPQIFKRERRTPYLLRRALTFDQAFAIETNAERFPGCMIREGLRRRYASGACHVLGYIGRVNDQKPPPGKQNEYDRLLEQGYFTRGMEEVVSEADLDLLARRGAFREKMIGRAGVEKSYDEALRGRDGLFILERDSDTGAREWIELMPAVAGETVELTIHIEVQRAIEAILAEVEDECPHKVRAHAVVMDPHTGEIVAIASNTNYDPNDFIPPTKGDRIKGYYEDPWKPLIAHAWADHKQAGSVFKILTAVAALQEGAATPATTTDCVGHYEPRVTTRFNCWTVSSHAAPHGELNVSGGLQHSCNIFFYTMGEKMGLDPVWRWGTAFGYGRKSGLDLPGEVPGILPSPEKNPRWMRTDSLNLAIGQGTLTVTPLQVARATAVIANGGTLVTPHVKRGLAPPAEHIDIEPAALEAIRKGLYDCTHVRGGTAYSSEFAKFGGVGKTGSAQRHDRQHPHCWFAGYFPFEQPKYVVIVLAEDAKGGGGHIAAPIAKKIAEVLPK